MKIIKIAIICAALAAISSTAMAVQVPEPVHSPHLVKINGDWFLRGKEKCIPIKLNRKGRSQLMLSDLQVFMDRRDDSLYLTVTRYFHTYTYRMNPLVFDKSYVLELVAMAPRETPTKKAGGPLDERYTGVFRAMVDCQLGPPDSWAAVEGDSRWKPHD